MTPLKIRHGRVCLFRTVQYAPYMFSSFTGENDLFNGLRINERCMKGGGVPHFSRNKQFSVPIKPFSAWGIWGRLIVYGGIRLRILDVSIWKISLFLLASAFLPMSSKIQHIFKIRYHIQLTGKKTLTPRFKGIMKMHLTKSDTYIMFANLLLTSALFRHEDT